MCHPGTENNHLVSKITWRYMIVTITPCMAITETNCFSSRNMFVGWKALTCTYLSIDIMIILYVEATNMHHRNQRVFQNIQCISPRKPGSTLTESLIVSPTRSKLSDASKSIILCKNKRKIKLKYASHFTCQIYKLSMNVQLLHVCRKSRGYWSLPTTITLVS